MRAGQDREIAYLFPRFYMSFPKPTSRHAWASSHQATLERELVAAAEVDEHRTRGQLANDPLRRKNLIDWLYAIFAFLGSD